MKVRLHPACLEEDMHFTVGVVIPPTAIKPVPEREWVSDPTAESGGYSKPTGRQATDAQGNLLFEVPVTAYDLDGHQMRNVHVRVRGLSAPLPALTYLQPVGEVVAEFSSYRNGSLTITCDELQPVESSPAVHRAGDAL